MSAWRKKLEASINSTLKDDSPVVYFIQSTTGGLIKIGYSNSIRRRIKELQNTSPVKLRVLATIPGSLEKETELHHRFRGGRKHGEWFNPSQELLQFIINILSGDEDFD